MEFTVLDNKREITEAHDRVVARLTDASTEDGIIDINISPASYRKKCKVFWLGNHGIYFSTNFTEERKVRCFVDFFGTDNPQIGKRKQINKTDIQINAPTSQVHMATYGQFLKDQNGSVYYAHRGRGNVKGSKTPHKFADWYPGPAEWVDVTSGGKKYKLLKISAIESPTFVDDVAGYVKAWREFRDFVKTPEYADLVGEPVDYWMVRAGKDGEDWPNQTARGIAAIHYYSIDLAKCTNKDGMLSKPELRKKVDKMGKKMQWRKHKLTEYEWGADFGQLQLIFSVKKGDRVCLMNPDTWKFLVGTCKRAYKYEADNKKYPNPHTVKVAWDDKVERTLPEYFKSRFSRSIKDLEKEEYDLIMSSIYDPLTVYLEQSGKPEIILNFDEIEKIIKGTLPPTARTTPQWWGNETGDPSRQCRGWMDADYKTAGVSGTIGDEEIRFVKVTPTQNASMMPSEPTSEECKKLRKKYEDVLKRKMNLIFYGPPGTGKTWIASRLAECFADETFSVTFHPSYSYEDFVEGFRPRVEDDLAVLGAGGVAFPYRVDGSPVGGGSSSQYKLDNGIFKLAVEHAEDNPAPSKTVLLIDEINRGNIPKIFGELITLIEKDKRGSELNLVYSKKPFSVPDNLYIIGTMNTADKSLVQMDDALKRRFAFEELMPQPELLVTDEHFTQENFTDAQKINARDYKKILESINENILGHDGDKSRKQFRDRQIGHSYFWTMKDDDDLRFVIKYEVIPLLQDYFYNDYGLLRKVLGSKEHDGHNYNIIGEDNRPTDLVNKGEGSVKFKKTDGTTDTKDMTLRNYLLEKFN